jgi:hypothetical protein
LLILSYYSLLIFWMFPVGPSWLVAASGRHSSFVAQHWQYKNVELIGTVLTISMVPATLAAIIIRIEWLRRGDAHL